MSSVPLKKSGRCWSVFAACCLMCGIGFGGGMTCMSLFMAPMIQAFEAPVTSVTLFFTIATLLCIPAVIIGPRVLAKNASITTGVCGLFMGFSYILIAMAPSLVTLYAAAVIFGLAYPMATTVMAPIIIDKWFYKKQGTLVGVAIACVGITSAILSPILTALIASAGWQTALMTLGALIAVVVGGCGFLLIRFDPLDMGILPYGVTQESIDAMRQSSGKGDESVALLGLTYKEFFKSPLVILLALALLFAGLTACINQQANTIVQFSGFSASIAGLVVTAASIGNIVGPLLLGWVRDKFGSTATSVCGVTIMVIGFACFLGAMASANAALLYVGGFVCGVGTCLGTMAGPLFTMDAAGPREYGPILGTLSVFVTVGNAIAAPIVSGIFDMSGSFFGSIVLLIVLAIAIAPLSLGSIRGLHKKWDRS